MSTNVEQKKEVDFSKVNTLTDFYKSLVGQRIFVICVRYSYRGVLACAGDGFIVLSQATAVEQMGSAQSDKPEQEDPIGSWLMISTDAIEIAMQPNMVNAALPGDDEQ